MWRGWDFFPLYYNPILLPAISRRLSFFLATLSPIINPTVDLFINCFVLLIYWSIITPIPRHLHCFCFILSLKAKWCESSKCVLFVCLEVILAILSILNSDVNFRISLSISMEKRTKFWIKVVLNLSINLRRADILTIVNIFKSINWVYSSICWWSLMSLIHINIRNSI